MKRLGKFSGKIYEENEVSTMKECGVTITEEQAKDAKYIHSLKIKNVFDCCDCMGCHMSQNR